MKEGYHDSHVGKWILPLLRVGDAACLFESAVDRLYAGGSGHLRFSAGDRRDVRCD